MAISVDQFSARLFNEYRPHFTGGLRRLADGVAFANGYQAHGATETCPGHSSILTGDYPARSGIIANKWVDPNAPRADKRVYCAEDERVKGSTSEHYTVSDVHLRVPTLGDRLKAADRASRVVAVAGKDRTAVMMAGHHADQRWWWHETGFMQNNASVPAPVAAQVNGAIARAIAAPREPLVPPPFCAAKERKIDLGDGLSVGTFRFARAAGDAAAFAAGPELDAATLAMAAALVQQMQLGRGNATDLLAIGLSATDFVGHAYGNEGIEICLQLMSLDSDLAGFFAVLDRLGIDYAVVLTADHGALDIPERADPADPQHPARIAEAATPKAIGEAVAQALHIAPPVFTSDWYVDTAVPPARKAEAVRLARALLSAQPQVYGTYTSTEIAAHPMPTGKPEDWSVLDRLRASFDPQRSSDLQVVYKPGITPIAKPKPGQVATHGSVWDYDRKVPILFWWKGIARADHEESARTIDIMPTLASLVGLPVPPAKIDGRCLDVIEGPADNCR